MTRPASEQAVEVLKPCPFCGGVPELRGGWACFVECKCGCETAGYDRSEDAITAWNQRVPLTSAPDLSKWLQADHIRLHAGEMTAQEMRTVQAVVRAMLAELASPVSAPEKEEGVLIRLKRPEGYEDVHPELLLQDAHIHPDFEPEIVASSLPPSQGRDRDALIELAHKLYYAAYSFGFEAGKVGTHVDTTIAGNKARDALHALICAIDAKEHQ